MSLPQQCLLACLMPAVLAFAGVCAAEEIIDLKEAAKDPDFAI
ncbi:MAG: diiron oxygenase, partial [Thermogutta sp.]|nr:diiron oxygenase [Thermogutta sp.]